MLSAVRESTTLQPVWRDEMADGKGCKCAAYDESECGCDVDWTPQEVYDLRTENEQLKEAIRRLAQQDATLSVQDGNVTVTMDATLTPEERDAVETAAMEADAHQHTQRAATLRGLLERMK